METIKLLTLAAIIIGSALLAAGLQGILLDWFTAWQQRRRCNRRQGAQGRFT